MRRWTITTVGALAVASALAGAAPVHADGQVTVQVSGSAATIAAVQVHLLDSSGLDVAPAACTGAGGSDIFILLTCPGLPDGRYRPAVSAVPDGAEVSWFCSPTDASIDPEPDGTALVRDGVAVNLCTVVITDGVAPSVITPSSTATSTTEVDSAGGGGRPTGAQLPATGRDTSLHVLAACALTALGLGCVRARRTVR